MDNCRNQLVSQVRLINLNRCQSLRDMPQITLAIDIGGQRKINRQQ